MSDQTDRMTRNLARMSEMGVTAAEAQWMLGRLSGTVMLTTSLDALQARREERAEAQS